MSLILICGSSPVNRHAGYFSPGGMNSTCGSPFCPRTLTVLSFTCWAKRFRENGEAYFCFITTPGIEPTNNLAEQAIRFVVIDRLITQGTRSETGRRWCEQIWTVIATCAQQSRSAFQFVLDSVQAYLSGTSPPSRMPSDP